MLITKHTKSNFDSLALRCYNNLDALIKRDTEFTKETGIKYNYFAAEKYHRLLREYYFTAEAKENTTLKTEYIDAHQELEEILEEYRKANEENERPYDRDVLAFYCKEFKRVVQGLKYKPAEL